MKRKQTTVADRQGTNAFTRRLERERVGRVLQDEDKRTAERDEKQRLLRLLRAARGEKVKS
jgi:hypothetical protein